MGKILIIKGADFSANAIDVVPVGGVSSPSITINAAGQVTIISDNTVYYTTNGSTPTTSSNRYTAPFNVTEDTTVKAIATDGTEFSSVVEKTYTVVRNWLKGYTDQQIIDGAVLTIGLNTDWDLQTEEPNKVITAVKVFIGTTAVGGILKVSDTDGNHLNTFNATKSGVVIFNLTDPVTIDGLGKFRINVNNSWVCGLNVRGIGFNAVRDYNVPMDICLVE